MVKGLARPEKESHLLLLFRHGDPANYTQERYTDNDNGWPGYQTVPALEVLLPENSGHFDEKEVRIILPIDSFTDRLTNGLPHSPVFVQIEEITQGLFPGDQASQRTLFNGRIMRGRRNYQGRTNVVGLFALPAKSRLDIALGIPCNHHCAWNLFSRGCGLNKASFTVNGTIDSADGQEITVTTANVTNKTGTYWRRGYIEKDGLRIMIRDWSDADPTKLQMARRVPDEWLTGAPTVVFVPGCDKTIETCRARYNNEERFMGLGYSIPAYNPIIESPS